MLYDKRWDAKVEPKADPFSMAALVAWLEKQDRSMEYCYGDTGGCLLHQYFTSLGFKKVNVGGQTWNHSGIRFPDSIDLPPGFDQIAVQGPRTFGGALDRARAALSGTSGSQHMNHDRQMGLAWGAMAGACLALGVTLHPAMFLATIIPLWGCWSHRNVR